MKRIPLPDNSYILYALALANAIGFAWASIAIESNGGGFIQAFLFGARGVLIGLAAGFGMASIANKIPRAAKAARPWGYLGLAIIGLSAPAMMSPVVYSRVSQVPISALPFWVHFTIALAVGFLVDGLILGIAATSGKLQDDEKPAESEIKPAKEKVKPATSEVKPAIFRCPVAGCGFERPTQAAISGHMSKHKREQAEVVGYQATFEPVTRAEATTK